jgi:hypothetical protein
MAAAPYRQVKQRRIERDLPTTAAQPDQRGRGQIPAVER